MSTMNYVKAASVTSINSASITGSLQVINTSGFPGPVFLLRIMNASNKDVAVSFDGSHANDYILANSTLELNFQNNAQPNNYTCLLKQGTHVYVSGDAGTGYIYVAAYYQANQ